MRKVIISGIIGNALEWYDFALYGHFVAIISRLYFPHSDAFVSLLVAFGAFAAGFFMRPLGAVLFGYIGDRFGRQAALSLSILLMAIPTASIGLLPTYAQIGIAAPILLTVIRLLQGLSLGGEFSGSIAFVVEHAPENRRGLAGSSAMFSMNIGILMGSAVAALFSHLLPQEAFETWGWRIPFLMGFLIGMVGLYIRHSLHESPVYLEAKKNKALSEAPTREVFKSYLPQLLTGIGVYLTVTIPFYTFVVFMNNYMSNIIGHSVRNSLIINTISMIVMTILVPVGGHLSDKYGRKIVMQTAALGFILLSYPSFKLLAADGFILPLIGQTIFAILVAFYMSPVPALLVELFPTRVRFTGVALSYNTSAAIFGGTAPIVSTFIIKHTGINESVAAYTILAAFVSMLTLIKLYDKSNETSAIAFEGEYERG